MRKLEGRVALISGSGRGIGRALALKLARDGARIVVNDLDAEPAEDVVAEIRACGSDAIACIGSITNPDFGAQFVESAIEGFGRLDIIVNNAGYTWDGVIQKMTDEQFQAMLDVHVTAPFRILRAAAGPIRAFASREAERGEEVFRKVVNVSSVAGLLGNAGQVNYSAAKAAVVGMTRTLAREWGRYRVNVNCVAFGFIRTRLTRPLEQRETTIDVDGRAISVGIPQSFISEMETRMIPLGRAGTTEDAANGAYLFCIPESDYVSGQVLTVGGGVSF